MSMINYPLTIDTCRQNAFKTVLAQQFDSHSRTMVITLQEDNEQFVADLSMTAVLYVTDEEHTEYPPLACSINEDGTVNVPISSLILTQRSGIYECSLVIFNRDSERLGTFPFSLDVVAGSTVPVDTFSDESVELLTTLIGRTTGAIEDTIQATAAANSAAERAEQAAEDAEAVSANVEQTSDGATITITDKDGTTTANIYNGQNGRDGVDGRDGADGFSPVASVTQDSDGATITITDKNGTTSASVNNGINGRDGVDGRNGTDGTSAFASVSKSGDTATITCTDANGTTTATVKDGTDGRDGTDGADGISPTAVVSKSGDVVTISITDREGTTTATVADGYTKSETDALIDDAKEDIIYCGLEPGGDEVTLSAGAVDGNLAKFTGGANDSHLLVDRTHITNVYVENESDGAKIRYVLLNQYPINVAGENINGKLYGGNINAGASYTFNANSYWSQCTYLWLNYTYTGQTYKYKLMTVTMDDGRVLNLYSNGTLNLDVLKNPTIYDKIDELEGVTSELRIENPTVARYMDEIDYSDDSGYTMTIMSSASNGYTATSASSFSYKTCRPRTLDLSWDAYSGASKYAIVVGDRTYYTTSTSISISNLIPNTTYKWAVYAMTSGSYKKVAIKSGTVNVIGQVRMINASDVYNMRDLGGWRTKWGKTIKYGKIFRGACLDKDSADRSQADANGLAEMLACGMNVEIDFRTEGGLDYNTPVLLDERKALPLTAYETGLSTNPEQYVAVIKKVLECLSENKGVYLHCIHGADRTGTICMLLEAMLGVSDLDCSIDYELTAFNAFQNRQASNTANCRAVNYASERRYKDMMEWFETNYPSATYPTLTDKVTAWYLAQNGTSMDDIYALRKAMLDGGCEDKITSVKFTATLDTQTMTPVFSCDRTYAEIETAINSGDIIKFTLDGSQVGMDNNYTTMNYNLNSGSGYIRVNILVGFTNHILQVNNNGTISYNSYEFATQ